MHQDWRTRNSVLESNPVVSKMRISSSDVPDDARLKRVDFE